MGADAIAEKDQGGASVLERVADAVDACDRARPRPGSLRELRRLLEDHPEAWRVAGDLAAYAAEQLIESIQTTPARQLSIKAGYHQMRRRLGYDCSTEIERGLIEAAALSYLRLQCAEIVYTTAVQRDGLSFQQGIYHEKLLSAAQKRYLRACGELARVRRLLRRPPVVQVNINEAGSQVVNALEVRGNEKSVG